MQPFLLTALDFPNFEGILVLHQGVTQGASHRHHERVPGGGQGGKLPGGHTLEEIKSHFLAAGSQTSGLAHPRLHAVRGHHSHHRHDSGARTEHLLTAPGPGVCCVRGTVIPGTRGRTE